MQRICGPFLKFIYVFREMLSISMFFAARFTLRQPKTAVRNALNLRTFCFEDYVSLCLLRDSLSCYTHSSDLFTSFKFIFLYLWYIPILSLFTNFTQFTPIFSYLYTTRKFFLIPDDPVAQNLIIFNFSNQMPDLDYIFLSGNDIVLIQWNFSWNLKY